MTLFDERPIKPMLAKTGEPFDSDDYLFELKWDGLRTLLFKAERRIELQNRNLRDVTTGYPEFHKLGPSIRGRFVILDGETVILNPDGVPDFHQMQNRFGVDDPKRAAVLGKTIPATYVAFDLLHLNGHDMLSIPLEERKRRLKSILRESPHLLYGDHVERNGTRFYKDALGKGFEGIIAKERGSQYLPGVRGSSWVKIKGSETIDCVIIGFTHGEGSRASTFGSLVLAGYNQKGELQHIGSVGGGFDHQTLDSLKSKLTSLIRKTPAIRGPIEVLSPVTWVRPSLVCEVRYLAMTNDKKLRFPRFSKLRADKPPEECKLDF